MEDSLSLDLTGASLKLIELEVEWPHDVFIADLRLLLKKKILEYGFPLRWAITAIREDHSNIDKFSRKLTLEAVVLVRFDNSNG